VARTRAKVVGKGEGGDPFKVDLPTYSMVPGTEKIEAGVLKSVEVLIPDDEVDEEGRPSEEKIRRKYRGQPRWDKPGVGGDTWIEKTS